MIRLSKECSNLISRLFHRNSTLFRLGENIGNNFLQRRIFHHDVVDGVGTENLTEYLADFVAQHADDAGFHSETLPIIAGAVGRLPAMLVKLNGVTAKTKPSSGRCST